MILGKSPSNSCYSVALPKAIIQFYNIQNSDRLLPEIHLIEAPDTMMLKVRIQRNPTHSYSKLRSIPARMVFIKSVVRRMGWVKGIDLVCVHSNEKDVFVIALADPDWKPSIPLSVRDDKNRAAHTDKPLTAHEILRKEAINSFQCEASEMMIKNKMDELRQEDQAACVPPEFHDLNLPAIDKPAPAHTIKRTLANNLTDGLLWGY